jgi:heme-degrading monooxygenase HmoA
MRKRTLILTLAAGMSLLSLFSSCSYTAPFRRVEAVGDDAEVLVTLSQVESKPGQRGAFFEDTKRVLAILPRQSGLVGYSFRFQLIGRRAWTMTAWKDEASQREFVRSPEHRDAVKNSGTTSQNMRFTSITMPASKLPLKWSDALKLLEQAPAYE